MVTLAFALIFVSQAIELKPIATLKEAGITEMSGIIKSRQFENTFWIHNDSGDKARVFAIKLDGSSISAPGGIGVTGAQNRDWEDITIGGNTLYVSDMGNNNSNRRDLAIYNVEEPNPLKVKATATATRIPVEYADQTAFPPAGKKPFDCEAIFYLRGKIYLVTKNRYNAVLPDVSANLYRLDSLDPSKVNKAVRIDSASNLTGWVTAADVSPNGKRLALLTHFPAMSIWIFGTDAKDDKFLSGPKRQILLRNAKQCEALCWKDDSTVIIGNEEGELFQVPVGR